MAQTDPLQPSRRRGYRPTALNIGCLMIVSRVALAGAGVVVGALVVWSISIGWFPSHGDRISRASNPGAFWWVMSVSSVVGLILISFGLFLR